MLSAFGYLPAYDISNMTNNKINTNSKFKQKHKTNTTQHTMSFA